MELYSFDLSSQQEEIAKKIYNESLVFDGLGNWGTLDNINSVDGIISGGINAMNVTINVSKHDFNKAIDRVIKYKKIIKDNSDKLVLVNTIEDFKKAKNEKKLAIVFLFQDSVAIGNNLEYLDVFHKLDVKVIQLAYNDQNFIGSGCCELFYSKLTNFGREVVRRMNELGMVIDLSHCSEETTLDAIEVSKVSVNFSGVVKRKSIYI